MGTDLNSSRSKFIPVSCNHPPSQVGLVFVVVVVVLPFSVVGAIFVLIFTGQ